ncbi:glucose-6-phosphate isomerase family protein [Dethiobacter alkaliphilus]|uniref:glucose-6-phosphate isomerase family protein n=1 Tax=Dethiobacter alkaliphilus TaxID=427926 RepID=UPI002227423F|nr:glucose-6-phosphate isomerase family protein [Dethiobacter alkaliphilus]MCW3488768.1 hypothetical protein [Dethiobacter alkaliphilus]
MYDLKETSGLSISTDENGKLTFWAELDSIDPDVRYKKDMQDVFYDKNGQGPDELYYMYRGVGYKEDRELMAKHGLRYDITVLRSGQIGPEYIKTVGHYHPLKPGTEVTYPEVYEVLYGTAHYLLQTEPDDDGVDVILVEAKPGDKVLIPPGYGHITINPGPEVLVMSNWVAYGFDSVYSPIKELGGGAYFELAAEGEDQRFIPNPRYKPAPRISLRQVQDHPELGLISGKPMYQEFISSPEKFAFLTQPENYF